MSLGGPGASTYCATCRVSAACDHATITLCPRRKKSVNRSKGERPYGRYRVAVLQWRVKQSFLSLLARRVGVYFGGFKMRSRDSGLGIGIGAPLSYPMHLPGHPGYHA